MSDSVTLISASAAICTAEYAKDENPIELAQNEHDEAYRQGWEDACQYIRERFEALEN